jgi:hypothetical protein
MRVFPDCYITVEKAIQFVQAEKLFYETALIQAGKGNTDGEWGTEYLDVVFMKLCVGQEQILT